ncbi:MAG: hypothetical protein LLG40_09890 [Deltaproteobacteria bacterium]|nr:hypothetical protein [Deltaproteobacteria bacterium]
MGKIKRIFLAILLLLVTCNGWAATYYVKTGGNDSAAGTSDGTAWAHCPGMVGWSGAAILAPGDTIKFRSQDSWNASDSFLMISTAGTTGSRITYDGSSYGTGTKATFLVTGRSSLYAVVQIRVSNITFTGFKVDTNKFPLSGIAVGYSSPSPAGDIENITVSECEVTMGQTEDGWVVTSPYDGLKYISRCSSSNGCTSTPRPGDGVNWSYYWDLYEGDRSADCTWSVSGTYFGREWYYSSIRRRVEVLQAAIFL